MYFREKGKLRRSPAVRGEIIGSQRRRLATSLLHALLDQHLIFLRYWKVWCGSQSLLLSLSFISQYNTCVYKVWTHLKLTIVLINEPKDKARLREFEEESCHLSDGLLPE